MRTFMVGVILYSVGKFNSFYPYNMGEKDSVLLLILTLGMIMAFVQDVKELIK